LFSAIRNAILPGRKNEITSLIDEFQYPKYGPGMMWERTRERVEEMGIQVVLNSPISCIEREGGRAVAVHVSGVRQGTAVTSDRRIPVSDVISSMPLGQLVLQMSPPAPPEVQAAAIGLRHRDFLTVALVVPERFSFPDNWIYIHDPSVAVGRIQNFGSWSPFLVKDGRTCLGLEYFVNQGDDLWNASDERLIELAQAELAALGLVPEGSVESGYVVREPKAYPVYDEHYQRHVSTIRQWLEVAAPNVHPVGRNGMHRYNNADHSMLTAMLSVDNIVRGYAAHDVWTVNVEQDYHEENSSGSLGSAGRPSVSCVGTGRAAPVIAGSARSVVRSLDG
jgi:protoporphyrinogen oxidase